MTHVHSGDGNNTDSNKGWFTLTLVLDFLFWTLVWLSLTTAPSQLMGQDKFVFTVQTAAPSATQTITIEGPAGIEAARVFKHLVEISCSSPGKCEYKDPADVVRKHFAALVLTLARTTPGSPIKVAADEAKAAQDKVTRVEAEFMASAGVTTTGQ